MSLDTPEFCITQIEVKGQYLFYATNVTDSKTYLWNTLYTMSSDNKDRKIF